MISEQHLAESYRNLGLGVPYEPWYPSAKVSIFLLATPVEIQNVKNFMKPNLTMLKLDNKASHQQENFVH